MFCALSCKAGVTWKQDSSNNMFWTYIFPFSFAFPPVPLVLKEVQQSLSLAIADEDDSVEGLFQHCFLSSVFFVFSPSFLHSASPFLFLPLCFSPFSSVFFLPLLSSSSSRLPLLFFISPRSLSFSFLFLLLFGSSFGFYSQRMQAFLVTVGVHHSGKGCQPRDVPPFDCSSAVSAANASPVFIASHFIWRRQWIVSKKRRSFQFQMDISNLVLGCFLQFCNQDPG